MELTPEIYGALTAIAIFAIQAAAKAIPDDATGFKGILRKVLKIASLYIENRKSSTEEPTPSGGTTGGGLGKGGGG